MRSASGTVLLHDGGTLDVDLQDHVVTLPERVANIGPRRSIPVPVDLVGLEQLALVAEARELRGLEEVVVDAVNLVAPAGPGGARHDIVVVRVPWLAAERLDDAVLPYPGGTRHDDEHRARRAFVGVLHRRPLCSHRGVSRSGTRTASSSTGSGASERMSVPLDGEVSSSRQAWRKSRSRPAGPRLDVPVP